MSFARLLLEIDPNLVSTLKSIDHEAKFPTAHVIKRKVHCFLFWAITYTVFEKRVIHNTLELLPRWQNLPVISWLLSKELPTINPQSIAVVATSQPYESAAPEEPVAYLDADKVMQFPDLQQKKRFEDALAEDSKLRELHVAQERARLQTELVYLVQWCWELESVSTVCFYSIEVLEDVEAAIQTALESRERGEVSLISPKSTLELAVGSGDKKREFPHMTVYVANRTHMPLCHPFDLVIPTSYECPMVGLQSFVCLGSPLITPTARAFSRATFNEAIQVYSNNLRV